MYDSTDSILKHWNQLIAENKYESAIEIPIGIVKNIIGDSNYDTVLMGSRFLDELCVNTGRVAQNSKEQIQQINIPKKYKNLIIATHVEDVGGHSQVIKEIYQILGDDCAILVTNLFGILDQENLPKILNGVDVFVAPKDLSLWKKLLWCQSFVQKCDPDRVVLMNHHQDAVAIASHVAASNSSQKFFYHHADFSFCLGVFLKDVTHVDPHNLGFYGCRTNLGMEDNVYLPLSVLKEENSFRGPGDFSLSKGFVTCTSGAALKFEGNYLYKYQEFICRILNATEGVHYHIGKLSENTIAQLYKQFDDLGIDKSRWKQKEWVPSISNFLVDHKVDLYFNSFPWGGGKATIEAMGAGIPIANHESYLSRNHCGVDLIYSEALIWRNPEDLTNKLRLVSKDFLQRQSELSREHFKKYYSEEGFRNSLEAVFFRREKIDCPLLHPYEPDHLMKFLHEEKFRKNSEFELKERVSVLEAIVAENARYIGNLEGKIKFIESRWLSPRAREFIFRILKALRLDSLERS